MARINFHQGELIPYVEVVNVYLDVSFSAPQHIVLASWRTNPDLQNLANRLNTFLSDITTSTYMDMLAEYIIGSGRYVGAYFLSVDHLSFDLAPGVGNQIQLFLKDTDIQQQVLLPAIQQGNLPPPTPNSCYFVFTPPGVLIGIDDAVFGYHQSTQTNNIHYAVIRHSKADRLFNPKAPPTSSITQQDFDSMTETTSHELVEVVTNPSLADDGWHTDNEMKNKEIADVCQGNGFSFHGYQVSSFWSNKQNACISNCWVQIRLKQPQVCLGGLIENELVEFFAQVSCLSPAQLTYEWTWEDPTIMVPILPTNNHQQHFSAKMPAAPNVVKVTVTITDTKQLRVSSKATIKAITAKDAEEQTTFCENMDRVRKFAEVNFLVNPLWDPLRDFTIHPIQERDIYEMHQNVQHFVQLTETLVRAYEGIQKQGPVI